MNSPNRVASKHFRKRVIKIGGSTVAIVFTCLKNSAAGFFPLRGRGNGERRGIHLGERSVAAFPDGIIGPLCPIGTNFFTSLNFA